jgi:hypothetical protein
MTRVRKALFRTNWIALRLGHQETPNACLPTFFVCIFSPDCLDLKPLITLVCDGEEVLLPDIQALVVTNLPSYSGGINLWNISM